MKHLVVTCLITLTLCTVSLGQQPQLSHHFGRGLLINDVIQAKAATHLMTRYLEKSSAVVVDIDVSKLDVQKAVQWLQENFRPARENPLPPEQLAMATGFVESLKTAGVSNLYLTASTRAIFDGGPLVVIPCEKPQAVLGLAALVVQGVPKKLNYVANVLENVVVVGPEGAVDRVLAGRGFARPDLILPLLNAERADHLAIISLPAEAKKDLAALWPDQLPNAPELEISPRALIEDVDSVRISWDLPPQPRMVANIITTSADGTARVESAIKQLRAMSPQATRAVETATTGATVSLEVTPERIGKLLEEMTGPARERASVQLDRNDLKQIGLAMHNYHAKHKHFPPRVLTNPDGKPLLSWRVTILPFIEQQALAREIKLDQAWDSRDNKRFGEMAIPTYSGNMQGTEHPTKTRIRVPVIKGSFWQGEGPPRTIRDITDGTSNTIAAFIAPDSAAVTWTSPEPWVLSEDDPKSDVFGDRERVNALFFDGSVRSFTKEELDNEKLKALLTFAGKELIE